MRTGHRQKFSIIAAMLALVAAALLPCRAELSLASSPGAAAFMLFDGKNTAPIFVETSADHAGKLNL